MHDVSILHDVFLALESELPFCLRLIHGPEADEVFISHHLGANESTRKIGVDLTRRFLRGRTAASCPCADFVLALGKESLLAQ